LFTNAKRRRKGVLSMYVLRSAKILLRVFSIWEK
jgi:hypothetical protein